MNSILNLVLFLSDFIQIVLNNIVVLIVSPLNVLASIIYQLGERVGLIEEEEPQTVEQSKNEEHKIGFQIMSNKTSVE
jgi:hypothetical protein